jgi:hypothetical protein
MALSDAQLMTAAAQLAQIAGHAAPARLTQLAGGKNNRVFRLDLVDDTPLILKSYFSHPGDTRDRLNAEWSFLTYAKLRGMNTVPVPLARDDATRTGLYSFAPGRKLLAGDIGAAEVDAAAALVRDINHPPRDFASFAEGSEACFTMAEHLATMDRRVARLGALDPQVPQMDDAQRLVDLTLVPVWARLRAKLIAEASAAGLGLTERLPAADTILSPSDFGFHNALCDQAGRITFIDFEYAGRDDPAKMVCDFFCQPEVPIPLAFFDRFLQGALAGNGLAARHAARCRILLDAYRIKWICIILNDFLPIGSARRQFAASGDWATRCANQLAKAQERLDALS